MHDREWPETGLVTRRSLLATAGLGSLMLSLGLNPYRASAASPFTRPFTTYGWVSEHFNPNHPAYPSGHRGTDYHQDGGADDTVRSIGKGTVVYTGSSIAKQELGCVVVIQHETHWSLYAHLHDFPGAGRSPYLVQQGQSVLNGTRLGTKGNTGRSNGAHLHLEMGPGRWISEQTRQSYANLINPDTVLRNAPNAPSTPTTPPQEEDDMINDSDRALLQAAATARQPFIRIQAAGRGIALIGANYFKGLAPSELEASSALISHHLTVSDETYDQYKALAIGGETAERSTIKTEARPLRLYRYKGGMIAVGPGGKHWTVPSDAYRVLLQALGLVGEVMRDLGDGDNELNFIKQVLSNVAPDPATTKTADTVLSLPHRDADDLARKVEAGILV
ncbi:M23 family metallopeptidase [Microbacterium arborescens]